VPAPLAQVLAGIRVLDLSRLLPGPFLTLILADLGAEVVKVEDPRIGDYLRAVPPLRRGVSERFAAVNRGKRSLALDLKSDPGRAAFLRMVDRSDIVVESFRPGVMERLGIAPAVLMQRNPRLVVCSLSGYGQSGSYAQKAGHDLDYMALAGALSVGGGVPAVPPLQVADMAGGGLWGATAVLAALLQRSKTGLGSHLDISMAEGALALLLAEIPSEGGREAGPSLLGGESPAYQVYRTADDRYLAVACLEPKFWQNFCQAIGRPVDVSEILPDARQGRVRAEIAAVIGEHPLSYWMARFDPLDCCCEPVLSVDELEAHEPFSSRQVFFSLDTPSGRWRQVRTPLGLPDHPAPAPALGQHSAEVLRDYGFSQDEIGALTGAGT
jgi:crotonobetainyl-CoA:carnitine CoA-transferase CaiB-like acyl-CoA transferase